MDNKDAPVSNKPHKRDIRAARNPAKTLDPTTGKLIGIFIFALGFAAIIAVAWLGYQKFARNETSTQGEAYVEAGLAPLTEQEPEVDINTLKLHKIGGIESIEGEWRMTYGIKSATMTMDKAGKFAIVVYMNEEGYERRMQFGNASYDDESGLLSLVSSYDPMPEINGVRIRGLTMRDFKIVPLTDPKTGNIYWTSRSGENLSQHVHPLFGLMGRPESFIVWKKQ